MKDLAQFFNYMNNIDFPYVVLRNFDNLPHSVQLGGHTDLDLLVYDFEHWKELYPDAKPTKPYPRVQFRVPIGETFVFCDVRHLGDGYYPYDFEKAILDTREWNAKGFYTPDAHHFRIALAYHVAHHKNHNSYKKWLGDVTPSQLLEALKESNIGWSEPKDFTVGKFNAYFKGATSVVQKSVDGVVKQQTGYQTYDLLANEARILMSIQSPHFPKVISYEDDKLEIEDCGAPLTISTLPDDWKQQMVEILLDLRNEKVQHRDIRPDNLMVKNGVIKLIDFGWSRLEDDAEDTPPSCLGYPYKPSYGFDDVFSMRQIIKQLEYKKGSILCEC